MQFLAALPYNFMWIELTEAHILHALAPAELEAFRTAAGTPADTDPVSSIISETALIVRGYCGQRNQLESGDLYVPGTLLRHAIAIAAYSVMARAGGQVLDPSRARKAAYNQAYKTLERVAEGKQPVERPGTPDSALFGGQTPSYDIYKVRQFDSVSQEGLV